MYEQLPGKTHILRNTKLRLQQMAPLLEPPFMHPGGRGDTALWEAGVVGGGKERVEVIPCWNKSASLS